MKWLIVAMLALGTTQLPLTVGAQTTEVDHLTKSQLLEKAKSIEQTAASSGGNASVTLAKYPEHFTMLALKEKSGGAEIHRKFADFFYVVRGEATLLTGGSIPDAKDSGPDEVKGSTVKDGVSTVLREGDFVHIPANVPHQLILPTGGEFIYFVIKVNESRAGSGS